MRQADWYTGPKDVSLRSPDDQMVLFEYANPERRRASLFWSRRLRKGTRTLWMR
jgi:hypothetical protein